MCLELGLEEVLDGDEGAGARHLDVAPAALELEDTDLVARDGQVDVAPVAVGDALPGHHHALLRERPRAVLERPELGHPAGPLQLPLVVVLLREGEEEALLSVLREEVVSFLIEKDRMKNHMQNF